jgi:hypothetical protein
MKNLNFVDPEVAERVVFKQEILNDLKQCFSGSNDERIGFIKWVDSITNEVALTPDEASVVLKLFETAKYIKPALLFDSKFFPIEQDDSGLLKRFFRTELFNDERIKSIPLLFCRGEYGIRSETIKKIRTHCTQDEVFAEAYQAKLAEIRNNYGSLQERAVFYLTKYYPNPLIHELEQPVFEMLRVYLNDTTISGYSVSDLLFIALLQTPDGIQIPHWNEENYLCRLLLDWAIRSNKDIFNKLFGDLATTDVFLIIRNHLKWRNDNIPQNEKKYAQFLEDQLPEFFSGNISQEYSDLLYEYSYISDLSFLNRYLARKIALAIIDNNREQILEISRLVENENKDLDINMKQLQFRISSAMKFFESDDHTKKWQDILRASRNDYDFLELLLSFLLKNKRDTSTTPVSLEDFVQQYIPLEIYFEILHLSLFQEQNEDVYQNMIKQYPDLSRRDALLDRLLPCFATIAIKDKDGMLSFLEDILNYYERDMRHFMDEIQYRHELTNRQVDYHECGMRLILYVLDRLCERHEKEHELIALIFEIIFIDLHAVPTICDITKKYPQVQHLVIEQCYTMLKRSWDTPICATISSHQVETVIPARIIGLYKGAWHGLKPLLIALRKTRMEWVDASLNIIKVNNESCFNDYGNLVSVINSYFDYFSDSLKSLRQDMADGFSDWLKPLPESKRDNLEKRLAEFTEIEKDREGFDITYTEPDPVWRYAYVRAIADLGVDVDGKGHYIHSVMDKVAKEDPSEMVRNAAEKASAKLKNLRNGWDGEEHYIKITLAFWWIKQASRLALNLPIDGKRSLEMRSLYERIYSSKAMDLDELAEILSPYELLRETIRREQEARIERLSGAEKLIRARLKI